MSLAASDLSALFSGRRREAAAGAPVHPPTRGDGQAPRVGTIQPAALNGPTAAPRASILLVEDHLDTARVMSKILRSMGMAVDTASCVTDAVAAAKVKRYDLLISDLGLPDGTGHDVLRQVGPIRAIALSGFGMDSDIQASLDAGFSKHLTKPIDLQDLKSAIEQTL